MVVIAESAGMSEIVAEHVEAVERRKEKTARPDARTEFRGVRRNPSGTYGALIWDPSRRTMVWLGTFRTAVEAARAYAAAAIKLKKPVTEKAARRPDARTGTGFRGVQRARNGKYGAQIRDPKAKGGALRWLGTFATAEDAARAYDGSAVKLRGARAITNFEQPAAATANGGVSCDDKDATAKSSSQAAGSPTTMVKKSGPRLSLGSWEERAPPRAHDTAAANLHGVAAQTSSRNPTAPTLVLKKWRSNSRSGFRGVSVTRTGSGNKYGAQIMDPVRRSNLWLGAFGTAEEAAGAYDAAAVRLYGAKAITNFEEQPMAAAAAAANDGEESSMDVLKWLNDSPEVPTLDFFSDSIVPGPQLDDLWTDLPPAKEEQMVDEFLNDMDFSDVLA